jgi:hypothetical protein
LRRSKLQLRLRAVEGLQFAWALMIGARRIFGYQRRGGVRTGRQRHTVRNLPAWRARHRSATCAALATSLAALYSIALSACTPSDGVGTLMVDPGRYSAYHCNDLVVRWKALIVREEELRALIDRAGDSGAGAVVGTIAYRADYESVLTQQKLLQRAAAEKKCDLNPATSQSDQTIR